MMDVVERVKLCRLIEKMSERKAYSEKLGMKNSSEFRGDRILHKKEGVD